MLLSPCKLFVFRLAMVLFGWIPGFSGATKHILTHFMIRRSKTPYAAHSRFFDVDDL